MTKFLAFMFWVILAILIVMSIPGCYTQKKARQQFGRAAATYPVISQEYCAQTFPIKERIIQGKDSIREDTLWIPGEVIRDTVRKDSFIYITQIIKEPGKVITREITRTDTILQENTAKTALCESRERILLDLVAREQKRTRNAALLAKIGGGISGILALILVGLARRKARKVLQPGSTNV